MKRIKPEVLQSNVAAVIGKIIDISHDKWVSVLDHPLYKIAESNGVHKNFMPAIMEVLSKRRLVELEGEKTGLKYKWVSQTFPDRGVLAIEAIQLYRESVKESNDNKPRKKKKEEIPEESPITILRKESLPLGLKVFTIVNDRVHQGVIVSARYNTEENFHSTSLLYQLKIYVGELDISSPKAEMFDEECKWFITIPLKKSEFFLTLEELSESLKSKTIPIPE